jgi:hypothetical protein
VFAIHRDQDLRAAERGGVHRLNGQGLAELGRTDIDGGREGPADCIADADLDLLLPVGLWHLGDHVRQLFAIRRDQPEAGRVFGRGLAAGAFSSGATTSTPPSFIRSNRPPGAVTSTCCSGSTGGSGGSGGSATTTDRPTATTASLNRIPNVGPMTASIN